MLDHISVPVVDLERSRAFYVAALAPLGVTIWREDATHVAFGRDGMPAFWIRPQPVLPGRLHLAFAARSRAEVDAFHQAALATGAPDHGGPGPRPEYHPHYYGAFALDPDGHNVEAVCHRP